MAEAPTPVAGQHDAPYPSDVGRFASGHLRDQIALVTRCLGVSGIGNTALNNTPHAFVQLACLALLPGDDKPDEELRALSTVADADYALWSHLVEGARNSTNFLTFAKAMLDGGDPPEPRGHCR
jgi:cobaltochelatase CobN